MFDTAVTGANSVSTSAQWALTKAVRQALAGRGIRVAAMHFGPAGARCGRVSLFDEGPSVPELCDLGRGETEFREHLDVVLSLVGR